MNAKSTEALTEHVCKYIKASDLFKDCELAMSAFFESNPDCSWGDNEKTMVSPNIIRKSLEIGGFIENECDKEIDIVLGRLYSIPDNIYIDLES